MFVACATMTSYASGIEVQGTAATVEAENMTEAHGLFVQWAMAQHPGFSIGGITVRDVTDTILKFAAARERSEHWSHPQVEGESPREELSNNPPPSSEGEG
jgi:hypothetical protein